MSQSDSSTDSTATVRIGQTIDVMSLAAEEDEEEDEKVDGAVMLREEIQLMIQRGSEVLDCVNEMMTIMLQLHRAMES